MILMSRIFYDIIFFRRMNKLDCIRSFKLNRTSLIMWGLLKKSEVYQVRTGKTKLYGYTASCSR